MRDNVCTYCSCSSTYCCTLQRSRNNTQEVKYSVSPSLFFLSLSLALFILFLTLCFYSLHLHRSPSSSFFPSMFLLSSLSLSLFDSLPFPVLISLSLSLTLLSLGIANNKLGTRQELCSWLDVIAKHDSHVLNGKYIPITYLLIGVIGHMYIWVKCSSRM